jgi:hypothetical protein
MSKYLVENWKSREGQISCCCISSDVSSYYKKKSDTWELLGTSEVEINKPKKVVKRQTFGDIDPLGNVRVPCKLPQNAKNISIIYEVEE